MYYKAYSKTSNCDKLKQAQLGCKVAANRNNLSGIKNINEI